MFPKFRSKKRKSKAIALDEERIAEKVVLRAKEMQDKEAQEKKQQKALAIYSHLSPRQKRRLKFIIRREGAKDE